MITLPPKDKDEGLETRLLLAECRGPSFPGYDLADATTCMQLMDVVLWNRVEDPTPYLAKHKTLLSVVTARGQFKGFERYPHYDSSIVHNIQQMINIANNAKDKRCGDFADFITAAMAVAGAQTFVDPSSGTLTGWRTAGSGSPGAGFTLFKTILGTEFYFNQPPPAKQVKPDGGS